MAEAMAERTGSEIAVIGMSCRFPGAKNIDEFWENLINGREAVPFLRDEELAALGVPPELPQNPNFVKTKQGALEDKEFFDAAFFGYTPKEAGIMDPQMRIFFESAWSALEDAGYDPGQYDGFIGLYAGAGGSTYWEYLASLTGTFGSLGYFAANLLMNKDFISTQIAYKLNLRGPCFAVQTACSTSLVAIHLACQGILNGECNMALAGGIRISHRKWSGYIYEEGLINSPDSHCRTFDARSKGTIDGEGSGVVLLRPLEEAEAAGDHIYAVIKGTAINNDGLRKVGYTAPSIEGQAETLRMAQQMAEIEAESIGYIETHGTATELGDPVEIEALKLAFKTDKKKFCALGSVKTNIGHLDAAAGVAGFIKTVLALEHRLIPPSLHYEAPNPRIDFENSPFYVNTRLSEWKRNGTPRRAGVSSFGLGGTNAHVVLEEGPLVPEPGQKVGDREYQLLLLSARSAAALEQMTVNLIEYFKKNLDGGHYQEKFANPVNPVPGVLNLADAAYTLMVGRKTFDYRRAAVGRNTENPLETLFVADTRSVHTYFAKKNEKQIVFMFSGQGSQYVDMGLDLYQKEPHFREEMDRCFQILETQSGYRIKDILYPGEAGSGLSPEEAKRQMDNVLYSGPIKFTIETALAKLIMKWGIKPDALIGHSFGEYAAAHLAGVFSLEEGLRLSVLRGKLMEKTPPGIMMSVTLPEEELTTFLKPYAGISLAAVNTPSNCIVSGPTPEVEAFEKELSEKGHECLRLNFPRASHSKLMELILDEFAAHVGKANLQPPKIPYIAGLTGDWISAAEAADPTYWAGHMVKTIRFSRGVKRLLETPGIIFVQVGTDRGLPLFVGKHLDEQNDNLRVNLLRSPRENVSDVYYLLNSLGLLWVNGIDIDGRAFYARERRNRVPLPTYPFERKYYWIDVVGTAAPGGKALEVYERRENPDEPGQEEDNPDLTADSFMAVSESEKKVLKIWKELLGHERIGKDDNFFELGGSSLAAVEVKRMIKEVFQREIPLVKILQYPTIRSLVENVLEVDEPKTDDNQNPPAEELEDLVDILEKF
jgi:phthiocerol/phenolphthiocerol synthesis type-I polyketide synthase E